MNEHNSPDPQTALEKWTVIERIGRTIGYAGMLFVEIGRASGPGAGGGVTGSLEDGPSRETSRVLGKGVVILGVATLATGGLLLDHYVFNDITSVLR